jgi:hypothetical protein
MGWFTEDDVKRLLALAVIDRLEFTLSSLLLSQSHVPVLSGRHLFSTDCSLYT